MIPFTVYTYYGSFPLPSHFAIINLPSSNPNHKKPKHNKLKNNSTTPTSQLCLTPVQLADEITCTKQCAAMSNVASGKPQNQKMAARCRLGYELHHAGITL
jgi:hypothetical protein